MEEPRKKKERRPGRARRRITLALALVIATAIAFVVLTKSRLVPYQLSKYINQHLLEDTRFQFSCDAVTGDLIHHVVLHNPVIRYHGPHASYNVFRADRVAIDYSIAGVFHLNLAVQDLTLENVNLQIRQDEEGRLILPLVGERGEPQAGGAVAPRVASTWRAPTGMNAAWGGCASSAAMPTSSIRMSRCSRSRWISTTKSSPYGSRT
jgi:hypothetical protein